MSLSSGSRLGPYEILSPLGAGGMGEVYKARDTRLDRTVAIKIYVRAFPDRGRQWPISTDGGTLPVWSRGNELFYRTEDNRLMVSTYTVVGDSFVAGKPRLWSDTRLFNMGLTQNFDLAPDGKRFAVLMSAEGPELRRTRHMLVLNFFEEVRRRVAAGAR